MVAVNNKIIGNALVEVSEILLNMDNEEFEKIPLEVLDYIEANKNSEYEWEYDKTLSIENQKISEYTLEILTYLCIEYILEGEEKEVAEKWFNLIPKIDNQQKNISSTSNIIFPNNQTNLKKDELNEDEIKNTENKPNVTSTALAIKKENIFRRILNRIKNFWGFK